MAASREKRMQEELKKLKSENLGVEAAVLISSDAMPLASEVPEGMEEELVSATASSLVAAGEKVAKDLARGDVEQVYMRCEGGDLLVVKVNREAVLACSIGDGAKMGLVLLEVGRCAGKLSEIV